MELEVKDLARGGAGVARMESGQVVFIPLTAPGDRVRVEVTEKTDRYAHARLLEVIRPSPVRQTPPCPIFGKCGGCQWQHIPYDLQFKTKRDGLKLALGRAGVSFAGSIDELPADQIWEYRNRIQMRGYRGSLGFHAAGTRELVEAEKCYIARPEINQALPAIRAEGALKEDRYKVEIEVTEIGEVRHAWNSQNAAFGFRQVHDGQNAKLQDWVSSALTPGRRVFDLYGGFGNLSLPLLKHPNPPAEIHCVDVTAPREHPPEVSRSVMSFHRSAVLPWLRRAIKESTFTSPHAGASAILDPPREGLSKDGAEIVAALRALGVTEVIAVGCDLDSWCRDLSRFDRDGWKVERVAALDLFPQTHHIESLALLRAT